MNDKLTLVILAAGMGSRFGGLKQIEPIGPNGEFIIDYSIYDALKAGFKRVVFIIKKENYEIFKETIGKRIEDKIDVVYAFQELEDLIEGYKLKKDRVKPWGTAHAILEVKDIVSSNFAIINADDFYGRDSYFLLRKFLEEQKDQNKQHYCMIGYKVSNTMTENGSVKRGIAEQKNSYLTKLIESKVEKINNEIIASPINGEKPFVLNENTLVSMNMFGFTKEIFPILEKEFKIFLNSLSKEDITSEYLIPDVVFNQIKNNIADVKILNTISKWYGVTYKEDKEEIVKAILKLIEEKEYPYNLWNQE